MTEAANHAARFSSRAVVERERFNPAPQKQKTDLPNNSPSVSRVPESLPFGEGLEFVARSQAHRIAPRGLLAPRALRFEGNFSVAIVFVGQVEELRRKDRQ